MRSNGHNFRDYVGLRANIRFEYPRSSNSGVNKAFKRRTHKIERRKWRHGDDRKRLAF